VESHVERAARCVETIWGVALGAVDAGVDVVLEIGLLQRRERKRFYARVANAGVALCVVVVDADRQVRRQRVEARNLADRRCKHRSAAPHPGRTRRRDGADGRRARHRATAGREQTTTRRYAIHAGTPKIAIERKESTATPTAATPSWTPLGAMRPSSSLMATNTARSPR
jgi:predicted kinase